MTGWQRFTILKDILKIAAGTANLPQAGRCGFADRKFIVVSSCRTCPTCSERLNSKYGMRVGELDVSRTGK
jgi:hypothetical protein